MSVSVKTVFSLIAGIKRHPSVETSLLLLAQEVQPNSDRLEMSSKDRSETGSGVGSGPASSTASKKSKASNSGSSDAIKVVCRFRPPRAPVKEPIVSKNGKHTYNPDQFKLNDATGEVHYVSDFQDGKHFAFDKVSPVSFQSYWKLLITVAGCIACQLRYTVATQPKHKYSARLATRSTL